MYPASRRLTTVACASDLVQAAQILMPASARFHLLRNVGQRREQIHNHDSRHHGAEVRTATWSSGQIAGGN